MLRAALTTTTALTVMASPAAAQTVDYGMDELMAVELQQTAIGDLDPVGVPLANTDGDGGDGADDDMRNDDSNTDFTFPPPGPNAVEQGERASAPGFSAVAVGFGSSAQDDTSVAVGTSNISTRNGAVAAGEGNFANTQGGVAIGSGNTSTGTLEASGAVAIGNDNLAAGTGSVAIGNANTASGEGAVALGNGSSATADGAVAIGPQAVADEVNLIALGSSLGRVRVAGITSEASRAAQQGALSLVTTDAFGNLGSFAFDPNQFAAFDSRITNLEAGFDALGNRVSNVEARLTALELATQRNRRFTNGGIAAAMALSGTHIIPDKTVSMSFNLATFEGQQGFSTSLVGRVTEGIYVSGGVTGSTVRGTTGGRVGLSFGF